MKVRSFPLRHLLLALFLAASALLVIVAGAVAAAAEARMGMLVGAAAGLVVLSLAVLWVGGLLLRGVREAAEACAALARGERSARRESWLVEFDDLWRAVEAAQARQERRECERDVADIERAYAFAAEEVARRQREREETRLEASLRRERSARLEAEELSHSKDGFVAMVSHELRTPLAAIYGWTRLLRRGLLDAQAQERALEVIERNTRAQTQLIDDLLDMSRAIRGSLRLEVGPVDLSNTLRAAADAVRPSADAKGVALAVTADEPVVIDGDGYRLQQVLCNLLANSIKFTPAGGRAEATLARTGDDALLRVRDNGDGIAAELLPHVFEAFRQGGNGSARVRGGLGIGLALVRHLVELHGGSITAESAGEGRGATFTIRLPASATQGAALHLAGSFASG